MVCAPLPLGSLPDILVVPQEPAGDIDGLRQPDKAFIVIADADLGLGERLIPAGDLLCRQFVFVLRPRSIRVMGMEADGVPVADVPDEGNLVAAMLVAKVTAEFENNRDGSQVRERRR